MEQERRKFKRKPVDLLALIKIGIIHQGRGYTRNISAKGVRVENRTIFARVRPNRVPELINTQIKISFPQQALTVMGKIVRVDTSKGDIAIQIYNTTDDAAWIDLCSEGALRDTPAGS